MTRAVAPVITPLDKPNARLKLTSTHLSWRAVSITVAYLAARGIGMLMWWALAAKAGRIDLQPWDGKWYLRIAELGYRGAAAGMVDAHNHALPDGAMAFFPGFPLAIRGFATLVGGNDLAAGIAVSTLAGIVGAYGVARLARQLGGDYRAEVIAVVLTAAAPMSIVFTLPYPEALLVALAAWALVAIREQWWWLAVVCTVAAGLVSPMAAPLIAVVMVAGLTALYRDGLGKGGAAAAVLCAPFGMAGYLLWVKENSGVPGGYFEITDRGWNNHIDWGITSARWIFRTLTADHEAFAVLTAVAIVAAVIAAITVRMPWMPWLYTALTICLVLIHAGLVQDRLRLLLSAFPLLIVAAIRLARRRRHVAVLATAAVALAGLWFGAYAVTVWQYAI
jgi:hypothetical protein